MINRRGFIKKSGLLVATSLLPYPAYLFAQKKQKLGVALVGLGYYSTDLLAPALQLTKYCELKGIVTGSPEKIPTWQSKYAIKDGNVYNYENMHEIANNNEIDVVYIVLPPALHAKYAIIAANAGKHVWCEKPMEVTAAKCQSIIDACHKNKVKLAIGYRMHHEPNTQILMKWAEALPFGNIEYVAAEAGYFDNRTDHWKQIKELGGGAMYDMGVYPLNAIRYTKGMEPVQVSASHETRRPEIYQEVDETTIFELKFEGGTIAQGKTSLGQSFNNLEASCEDGSYYLRPFQSYTGVQGRASDGTELLPFKGNQQAKQMDDDALAIMHDQPMLVPGEEGLKDIHIVEKIYESAANNSKWIFI
ncbi:Gfo/Idh/MocA family protein [Galbibacter pacificus]|uniref:Gfo/Idh/MocA family oxidoreductase n=1 Tax=Galbibacter pacificus TaxID=2996052 RepID=A0ABT6FMF5_9FLAO|nr:Gfo/Idh/MocA family oxidoreductase [Galbibacter pacificus]MDG3580964.1 Gfo/Idh/MocA family oxidoreductase [Galbibacter pacificus]MDG3584442.1 Gfo/Idh/MocA family oxidoreductase [Galbibacter pacificus]